MDIVEKIGLCGTIYEEIQTSISTILGSIEKFMKATNCPPLTDCWPHIKKININNITDVEMYGKTGEIIKYILFILTVISSYSFIFPPQPHQKKKKRHRNTSYLNTPCT